MKPFNGRVDLRRADPVLEEAKLRLYTPIIVAFGIAMVPGMILLAIPARLLLDPILDVILGMSVLFWTAIGFWQIWRYIPRIEFVRIRSRRGRVLVDIVKDRETPAKFAGFLDVLRSRIETSALS